MITTPQFLLRYPEFNGIDPALVQLHLDESEQDCLEEFWGEKRSRGAMALTAHELTLRFYQAQILVGAQGEIEEGKIPDFSKAVLKDSNFATRTADEWYATTTYGGTYLRIRASLCIIGAMNLS